MVIKALSSGDCPGEMIASTAFPETGKAAAGTHKPDERRLRAVIDEHADFIWRSLRRLGLPSDAAEDAAQRVFLVASQRLGGIAPGAEQAFLFRTAVHVASRARRAYIRRREDLHADPGVELVDSAPSTEELVDRHQARALLEQALDTMDLDARAVFILYELEGKPTAAIADILDLPAGTVASRLRRARKEFQAFIKRIEAAEQRRRNR